MAWVPGAYQASVEPPPTATLPSGVTAVAA